MNLYKINNNLYINLTMLAGILYITGGKAEVTISNTKYTILKDEADRIINYLTGK